MRPETLSLRINGQMQTVPAGLSVMAALVLAGQAVTRYSPSGEARSAVCGMGICQECRVQIDGLRRLACQTSVAADMDVWTGEAQP